MHLPRRVIAVRCRIHRRFVLALHVPWLRLHKARAISEVTCLSRTATCGGLGMSRVPVSMRCSGEHAHCLDVKKGRRGYAVTCRTLTPECVHIAFA